MSILTFEDVSYHYNDGKKNLEILKNCSYTFERGKFYTLLGPSGSGKTTTLALASGLDSTKQGKILFDGKDIKKIGLNKYRRNNISIVFQSYNLLTYMNSYDNVLSGVKIAGEKKTKEQIASILESVGINESEIRRGVLKLSGGQQQRIAIARALARDVDLIFADEPTGNLDQDTAKEIIALFKKLASEGKCVVVVTHSESLAKQSDVILKMENKQLVEYKK